MIYTDIGNKTGWKKVIQIVNRQARSSIHPMIEYRGEMTVLGVTAPSIKMAKKIARDIRDRYREALIQARIDGQIVADEPWGGIIYSEGTDFIKR